MLKIRKDNQFTWAWAITRDGQAIDLTTATNLKYKYQIKDQSGRVDILSYAKTGNIISTVFLPTQPGIYNLLLTFDLPADGPCAVDVDAFEIVKSSEEASDASEFTVTSEMAIGFTGKNAYEVWLDTHEGTLAEYEAWLRQPAADAASSVALIEEAIEQNEAIRLQSEINRGIAEGLRAEAEQDRISAEIIRNDNEADRIEAEGLRAGAETSRQTAEGLRQQAENKRQTNTSTAISNAEQATDDANDAALLANEKAGLANNAALLANEKAGLAATATTQANDARDGANSAAQSATNLVNSYATDLAAKVAKTDIEQVRSHATDKVASSKLLYDELTALENAVDAVTVDTSSNTADIRLLENVINSANINQETTATVTGVDTVLLPKTAANTGMQVQLFGQSAQNLVVNGDFRNGTSGWVNANSTNSVTNGILTNTGNGTSSTPHIYSIIGVRIIGNKYYLRANVTPKSSLCAQLTLSSAETVQSITNLIINNPYLLSGVITASTTYDLAVIIHVYNSTTDANGASIEVDNVIAINLTATFGAGNEPTKEQCDILFANYFEGSDNVLGTGRIRSVNSAGLIPSYLYFNGGQLRSNGLIKDEIRKGTNGYELVKRVGVGTSNGNIVTGGDFSNPADWEVVGGTSEISNGTLKIIANNGMTSFARQNVAITAGKIYNYSINIISGSGHCYLQLGDNNLINIYSNTFGLMQGWFLATTNITYIKIVKEVSDNTSREFNNFSITEYNASEGTATESTATIIGSNIHYTLANPVITPIPHAGLLNSNSNGTAYFEPIIADAGVYGSNLSVQLTDYPISSFELIRKYANGTYTELNTATAVIAGDGLSFTHPDLASDDLVMFTYAYNKESIGRSITLTHYDSRYVKADTANGKTYRIVPVVTNGVVSWTTVEI